MKTKCEIIDEITEEIGFALIKFPSWPTDPIHAAGIVAEESGEIMKACLEATYEPEKSNLEDARKEAIQTAAMAIRFIYGMDKYRLRQSDQVNQYEELVNDQTI